MQDETVDTGPALIIPGHISEAMSNYVYEFEEEGYEQVLFTPLMVLGVKTRERAPSNTRTPPFNTPSNTPEQVLFGAAMIFNSQGPEPADVAHQWEEDDIARVFLQKADPSTVYSKVPHAHTTYFQSSVCTEDF
jgi:hypothetical protein